MDVSITAEEALRLREGLVVADLVRRGLVPPSACFVGTVVVVVESVSVAVAVDVSAGSGSAAVFRFRFLFRTCGGTVAA